MKVFLIFPQADKRTGVYIKKAFTNLGHEVTVADPKLQKAYDIGMVCANLQPDLTFCSRTPSLSDIAGVLKEHSGKLAMWNLDVRDNVNHWRNLFPLMKACDKFFTVGGADAYRKAGFDNVEWLTQGIDPDVHKPIEHTPEQMKKYGCDILFVGSYGSLWEGRKEFLDKLMQQDKYSVKIFGNHSPMNLPFLNDTEANVAYNCARVNVGFSGWPNVMNYTSVRDWKILATGKSLLTRCKYNIYSPAVPFYFADFDMFMDIINAQWKADLVSKGIGQEIMASKIKENHTYTHRIKRALDLLRLK